ncbi:MAG: phosphopantetheine-binding protein [Pirellulaceae bacterium]|nr:phosphopantetheine-binding protein [Pirellulaceae bacterium]
MNHANVSLAELTLNVLCDHCGKTFSFPLKSETFLCPHCGQSMSRIQAIESFLRTAMATAFAYDRQLIKGASRLNEIGDSMGTIELLMKLERDFGISINHDDIEELETVAAVTTYIHRKMLHR